MLKLFISLLGCIFFFSAYANANESENNLKNIQDRFHTTFNNIKIINFKKTEIPGLYEINMGNAIIYYYAKKEYLFFGQIYTKDGINLTRKSQQDSVKLALKTLPMDSALVIGDQNGIPMIEFTDPECPYCQAFESYFNTIKDSYKVKRIIFFDNRIHPWSSKKVEHILCSKNKEKAYYEIYNNIEPKFYKTCDKAKSIMAKNLEIAKAIGVSGTPTFILNNEVVTGFRKQLITNFLNKKNEVLNKKIGDKNVREAKTK